MKLRARNFRLTRGLGDELVIVDERHMVAHRLGAEAAAVWQSCDGGVDIDRIAGQTGLPPARVEELLSDLAGLELLIEEPAPATLTESLTAEQTRRRVLGRMVVGGVGLGLGVPAITSMVLPTAAAAFASLSNPTSPVNPGGPSNVNPGTPASVTATTTPVTTTVPATTKTTGTTTSPGGTPSVKHKTKTKTKPVTATTTTPGVTSGTGTSGTGKTVIDAPIKLAKGQLPFTGDDLIPQAAAASAMVAAGVAARLKLREPTPDPAD